MILPEMTTDLDRAHAAMDQSDTLRLRFYEQLADTDLFILLDADPVGDTVTPQVFQIDGAPHVLVFDAEERLSAFTGRAAPYAGLPGRALVQMMAGQGIGLALNPTVAPSDMVIPADAVDWLATTLDHAPEPAEARLTGVHRPTGLPEAVLEALDRKLTRAAGLADHALLVAADYADGGRGHVLAFVDAPDTAHGALAHAAGEALTFSGIDAGVMDVMFVSSADPIALRLGRVGLRFDLPVLSRPTPAVPMAPGSDPSAPPKLR
ncbi:SseB protein N-terminal domain-containing protein [Loktanella fryxellensis]|uniref:SseB protein N-terminal domain-containing protein n=1 Tax=Loktanella fryxellensis TaxID=245187 RepID=A0A1H8B3X1_9RHOB|nr:SseB family protein [Loktanella fryxellensis]SEM76794.1 SseB protein N-terminal domain-containing protein [Loktanella fryxellensis]